MEILSIFIAVSYPLIFTGYFAKRFSVKIENIFKLDEIKQFKDRKVEKAKPNYKERFTFFFWTIVFGIIFGLSQILLFQLTEYFTTDFIFLDRMAYLTIYPFLPGLFIGMSVAASFMYYKANRKGRSNLKEMLLSVESGYTGYQEYKFSKAIVYIFPALALAGNIIAFNNFIGIKNNELVFQQALSNQSTSKPIDEINKIVFFSHRKAPNGNIVCNSSPTIFFNDGTSISTLNLIYNKDINLFVDLLQSESTHKIPVNEVRGYKKT